MFLLGQFFCGTDEQIRQMLRKGACDSAVGIGGTNGAGADAGDDGTGASAGGAGDAADKGSSDSGVLILFSDPGLAAKLCADLQRPSVDMMDKVVVHS